ncbi:MAG: DUF624 domain-containing protein [Bacillota bacterium]|nr:DUF624 domain-containing protein [Bacillota bacterium]
MFRSDNLFSRFMNVLFDIICVSVLWILCSVPLLTAGAASTAAYYAMAKSVRYKTGYTVKEFFHSFRYNMKQSIPITIAFWIIMAVLLMDIWYVWTNDNKLNSAIFMVLIFILFLVAGITLYIYPLLSRFEKGTLDLIKTAAFVMFKYLPITICLLLAFGIACIGIYLMPWSVFVLPGAFMYGITFPVEWILRKLMPKADEEDEEAEKWYYQ